MKNARTGRNWARLEGRVADAVELLTGQFAAAPIPLYPIATARQICKWEFGEFVAGGGLSAESGGFRIFLNCPDGYAAVWQRVLEDRADGGRSLPPKARFVIAHEIAHTFYYDLRPKIPTPIIDWSLKHGLNQLERACNRGAADLLIPARLLEKYLLEAPSVSAGLVASIAETFRVPIETAVYRLQRSRAWAERASGAVLLEILGDRWYVTACAFDGPLSHLLPSIKYGASQEDIPPTLRHCIGKSVQGVDGDHHLPVDIPAGTLIQPCMVSIRGVGGKPKRILITITRSSDPIRARTSINQI